MLVRSGSVFAWIVTVSVFASACVTSGEASGEPSPRDPADPHGAPIAATDPPQRAPGAAALRAVQLDAAQRVEDATYSFASAPTSYVSHNVTLAARVDALTSGFRIESRSLRVQIEAASDNAAYTLPTIDNGNAQSIRWQRENFTEWVVNGPLGVEHGAEISAPNSSSSMLEYRFRVDGLHPVSRDRGAIALNDDNGRTQLEYRDAFAYDADGNDVPIELGVEASEIVWRLNAHGARYPLHVDPILATPAGTMSPTTARGAEFGSVIGMSSNTYVVGSPSFNGVAGSVTDQGAAYVYDYSPGLATWTFRAALYPGVPQTNGRFGACVAIAGATLLVGEPGRSSGSGQLYIYARNASLGWDPVTSFAPAGTAAGDGFGSACALHNNTFAAASPGRASGRGSVFVYNRGASSWIFEQEVVPADAAAGDRFGTSVDLTSILTGDYTLTVGAPMQSVVSHSEAGSAYFYVRHPSTTTWLLEDKVYAAGAPSGARFATSVAVDGLYAVVGAPWLGSGTAFTYRHVGTDWNLESTLAPSDAAPRFGSSVDISGTTTIVGAPYGATFSGQVCGEAFLFTRNASAMWLEVAKKSPSAPEDGQLYGSAVAIEGSLAAMGPGNVTRALPMYPFVLSGAVWPIGTSLESPDSPYSTLFGSSLAISGDTVLVGASGSDVLNNATPSRESGQGRAYFFNRVSGAWKFDATFTRGSAHNVFAGAVALDGDTAAIAEWGCSTPPATANGCVHIYTRTAGLWMYRTTISSPSPESGELFGFQLQLRNGTLVVSAPQRGTSDEGSAFVFVGSGATWTYQATLSRAMPAADDVCGWSITLGMNRVAMGCRTTDTGAVVVFTRSGSTWSGGVELLASDVTAGDSFGATVAMASNNDSRIAVGAPSQSAAGASGVGAAYLFETGPGGTWTETKLPASSTVAEAANGGALELTADTLLVGAPGGLTGDGHVDVFFRRANGAWTSAGALSEATLSPGAGLGGKISLGGSQLVVAAIRDDLEGLNAGRVFAYDVARSLGEPCSTSAVCASGFCADGVCCNNACNGGAPNDCMSCSTLAGGIVDGQCGPIAMDNTVLCRLPIGTCDLAEYCVNTMLTCPSDALKSAGTPCRNATGVCDVPETCSGSSPLCPANAFAAAGVACRSASGACDVAETCTGASASCPADSFAGPSTPCRVSSGACDPAESCTGGGPSCPADVNGCCAGAADCDDGDACTLDACTGGVCSTSPVAGCCTTDGQCEDGDVCTTNACVLNACVRTALTECCNVDIECNDGDDCTSDTCVGNSCEHLTIPGCGVMDAGMVEDDAGVGLAADMGTETADGSVAAMDASEVSDMLLTSDAEMTTDGSTLGDGGDDAAGASDAASSLDAQASDASPPADGSMVDAAQNAPPSSTNCTCDVPASTPNTQTHALFALLFCVGVLSRRLVGERRRRR